MATAHALIVEDEPHIRELLALHLGLEGVTVSECADGAEALEMIGASRFDVVVLDLMLPRIDGLTVCAAIRRSVHNSDTPVMILTARREESDTVLGLETGADDYLTKPFGIREFIARVRALLRRPRRGAGTSGPALPVVEEAGIRIDPARRLVHVDEHAVDLTPNEFETLLLLASHPGIVFSRETLLARIWSRETHVTARSVDTLIKRLRQKIETESEVPTRILTVWGTGYKFTDG